MRTRLFVSSSGQALVESALILPLVLLLVLGVVELSYALLDQHVVTRLAREAANLISRNAELDDAGDAMRTMSSRPVDFDSNARMILSVLKRGATTGTSNYDKLILYQRYEYGALGEQSALTTAGSGSFPAGSNYVAADSDNDTNLQVTNVPPDLVSVKGAMIYVAEIYARHDLITPLDGFGVAAPTTLYSIAYF